MCFSNAALDHSFTNRIAYFASGNHRVLGSSPAQRVAFMAANLTRSIQVVEHVASTHGKDGTVDVFICGDLDLHID